MTARRSLTSLVVPFRHGLAAVVVVGWLCQGVGAQETAVDLTSAAHVLAWLSDADGSGDVSAGEWAHYLAGLPTDAEVDGARARIVSVVMTRVLDGVAGESLSTVSVEAALAQSDRDGNGELSADEVLGGDQASPADRYRSLFVQAVALGVDVDDDGAVSRAEWAAAVGGGGSVGGGGAVPGDVLLAWVARAEAHVPADRGAFGPSTLIATIKAGLDATHDGVFARDDAERLFASLDADGDGALSRAERTPSRSAWRPGQPAAGVDLVPATTERKPVMPWQRSLEDAWELVRRSGKPLLVCVNMDGESACESLVRGRYRDPAFAELVAGFIPVIASPDVRHQLDRDDRGRRLVDERFGSIVNGEALELEPIAYERYGKGTRVAPRHIGIAPDGQVLFDLYLLFDLAQIDATLREHGNFDSALPDPSTMSPAALLATPDAAARDVLERMFAQGDEPTRRMLAGAALDRERGVQHPELLRQALRDPVEGVRRRVALLIASHPGLAPLDLLPDAARVLADRPVALAFMADGLARRAARSEDETEGVRARRLGRLFAAAGVSSRVLDVELWKLALQGVSSGAVSSVDDVSVLYNAMAGLEDQLDADLDNPYLWSLLARAALRTAEHLLPQGSGDVGFLLKDAQTFARNALSRGAEDGVTHALLARASHLLGEAVEAGEAAARALPGLLLQAESPLAAQALEALLWSRYAQLTKVLGGEADWPTELVADLLAAGDVLSSHPAAGAAAVVTALDAAVDLELFAWHGAWARSAARRLPAAPDIHNHLRWHVLRDEGAAALGGVYEALGEAAADESAAQLWFKAYADIMAAERFRETRQPERALGAYRQSVETFRRSYEADSTFVNALHFAGLALSGMARVLLDADRLDRAAEVVAEWADTGPESAEMVDGLGDSPLDVMRDVLRTLRQADRGATADALARALREAGVDV